MGVGLEGARGQCATLDSEKIAKNLEKEGKNQEKRGQIRKKRGKRGKKSGKIGKKEEKLGRKGKDGEGSFTLPLLTDRAGYATVHM